MKVKPSALLSYTVCKRQAWFNQRNINPDPGNPFIEIGKLIHEKSYEDLGERSVELPGMKIDVIWKNGRVTAVGEIKKSSKMLEGAKMQLLYYMYELKKRGIITVGKILIPKERKTIDVELTEENEKKIESFTREAEEILFLNEPPETKRRGVCEKCGYFELCWA